MRAAVFNIRKFIPQFMSMREIVNSTLTFQLHRQFILPKFIGNEIHIFLPNIQFTMIPQQTINSKCSVRKPSIQASFAKHQIRTIPNKMCSELACW